MQKVVVEKPKEKVKVEEEWRPIGDRKLWLDICLEREVLNRDEGLFLFRSKKCQQQDAGNGNVLVLDVETEEKVYWNRFFEPTKQMLLDHKKERQEELAKEILETNKHQMAQTEANLEKLRLQRLRERALEAPIGKAGAKKMAKGLSKKAGSPDAKPSGRPAVAPFEDRELKRQIASGHRAAQAEKPSKVERLKRRIEDGRQTIYTEVSRRVTDLLYFLCQKLTIELVEEDQIPAMRERYSGKSGYQNGPLDMTRRGRSLGLKPFTQEQLDFGLWCLADMPLNMKPGAKFQLDLNGSIAGAYAPSSFQPSSAATLQVVLRPLLDPRRSQWLVPNKSGFGFEPQSDILHIARSHPDWKPEMYVDHQVILEFLDHEMGLRVQGPVGVKHIQFKGRTLEGRLRELGFKDAKERAEEKAEKDEQKRKKKAQAAASGV